MEQRKLENEATVTQTFTLIALYFDLTIAISVGLEWVIHDSITNLIIPMTTAMKSLTSSDKIIEIKRQDRSGEISDIGRIGSSLQREDDQK